MALIVTLFCLALAKNVLSLTCLSSNSTSPKAAILGLTPNIELDCKTYINQVRKIQNLKPLENLPESDLRCFSLFVQRDFGEVVVKGCAPKSSCDMLKPNYAKLSRFPVKCVECEGKNCNKASREQFRTVIVIFGLIFNFFTKI
ncbi:uncharacterized protein LOC123004008 [Tribolium madens]|uniref:uncharacterized protein LOC123004008 n=1 Tax=Tribolium madens TaxID=41895 RepID=UPI001CF72CE2|nr:uncharacterized protein LOC123004008 [Tribolium madens]